MHQACLLLVVPGLEITYTKVRIYILQIGGGGEGGRAVMLSGYDSWL